MLLRAHMSATAAGSSVQQQMVLVLVGLPGAGKSTLVAALQSRCPGRFVRVCQDVLKTRPKCEKATREALAEGRSPIIDRTNVDQKQRESFLNIAREHSAVAHAVFLQVEPKLCMERIAARTEHETNPKPFVVNMMKGRLRAPTGSEGFAQVDTVSTPADVAALVSRVAGGAGAAAASPSAAVPKQTTEKRRSKNAAAVPSLAKPVATARNSDDSGGVDLTTCTEQQERPKKRSKNAIH